MSVKQTLSSAGWQPSSKHAHHVWGSLYSEMAVEWSGAFHIAVLFSQNIWELGLLSSMCL